MSWNNPKIASAQIAQLPSTKTKSLWIQLSKLHLLQRQRKIWTIRLILVNLLRARNDSQVWECIFRLTVTVLLMKWRTSQSLGLNQTKPRYLPLLKPQNQNQFRMKIQMSFTSRERQLAKKMLPAAVDSKLREKSLTSTWKTLSTHASSLTNLGSLLRGSRRKMRQVTSTW